VVVSMLLFLSTAAIPAVEAEPANLPLNEAVSSSIEQRVTSSSILGRLLYAFDRAAWVSSDSLIAVVPKDQLGRTGGYIVELTDPGTLRVTYFRGAVATAQSFFVAEVRNGGVIRKELLARPIPLTAAQTILARARDSAMSAATERNYRPCTAAPFNTVVMPPRDNGPVAVYLLSARLDTKSYPMGGNYRVTVGADGRAIDSRAYSKSCLNLPLPKTSAKSQPASLVMTHLLDTVPTELHVFASLSLRMTLIVAIADEGSKEMRLWSVRGGEIASVTGKK
jgi:hypothetical protein